MAEASADMVFGVELFLWDSILLPLIMATAAKVSYEARRFFSAMRCKDKPIK
jgi:hypothetical protein